MKIHRELAKQIYDVANILLPYVNREIRQKHGDADDLQMLLLTGGGKTDDDMQTYKKTGDCR